MTGKNQIVNYNAYIYDNSMGIMFTISEAPALINKPQENQVARSHIKHADEHPAA